LRLRGADGQDLFGFEWYRPELRTYRPVVGDYPGGLDNMRFRQRGLTDVGPVGISYLKRLAREWAAIKGQ
jgi:hypothetical protein